MENKAGRIWEDAKRGRSEQEEGGKVETVTKGVGGRFCDCGRYGDGGCGETTDLPRASCLKRLYCVHASCGSVLFFWPQCSPSNLVNGFSKRIITDHSFVRATEKTLKSAMDPSNVAKLAELGVLLGKHTTKKPPLRQTVVKEDGKATTARTATKLGRRSLGSKRMPRKWEGIGEMNHDALMQLPYPPPHEQGEGYIESREVMRDVKNTAPVPGYNAIHASYSKKNDGEEHVDDLQYQSRDVEGKRVELMNYIDVMQTEIAKSKDELEEEKAKRESAEKANIELEGEREDFEDEVEEVLGELMVSGRTKCERSAKAARTHVL